MDSKERIDQLTDQLKEAGYRYYVLDDPTMEDYEYDRLYRELEELESAHPELARADSPTKRVGGEVLSQFEKVSHPVPLMSLQDVFSMEELNDFLEKPSPPREMWRFPWSRRSTACPWRWNMWTGNSSGARPGATAR